MTRSNGPRALVVQKEADIRSLVSQALESRGFVVSLASDAAAAVRFLLNLKFDAVIVDLQLPDADGLRVLDVALERSPGTVSVVVGHGGIPEAVEVIKRGARDFLPKPFNVRRLTEIVERELTHAAATPPPDASDEGREEHPAFSEIIGRGPAMEEMFSLVRRVAPLDTTVLLQGETGTGKELVARTLHEASPRAGHRFVAFNAAAIPEGLAESELFGHAKGAFTGAVSARVGRFELAHRGTLFIDEVALMPLALQSKLLRALQEREVERVGDSTPIRFDARVVAASSADLTKMVREGTFRQDLFYRLNVVRITVPPLRARGDDVALLADYFLHRACLRHGVAPRRLSGSALEALIHHDWPGNVRELENAMEHAVALCGPAPEITVDRLPPELSHGGRTLPFSEITIPEGGINLPAVLSQLEGQLIQQSLERTDGNKVQAAKLLRLNRTTLIDKLNRMSRARATAKIKPEDRGHRSLMVG